MAKPHPSPVDVVIDTPTIRLGQLMKLAGLVDSGGDVRAILEAGDVQVNGAAETRRGRQLHHDDQVDFAGTRVRVVSRPGI